MTTLTVRLGHRTPMEGASRTRPPGPAYGPRGLASMLAAVLAAVLVCGVVVSG